MEQESFTSWCGACHELCDYWKEQKKSTRKKAGIVTFFVPSSSLMIYHSLQEVRVRFAGFGAEEDEWVNVKKAVRERSVALEHSECQKVKVGDLVLCFQVI